MFYKSNQHKFNVYHSDTFIFIGVLMQYLSTFLLCNCIFYCFLFVLLNKTPTFAVYHYDTRNNV